jgi:hypothetical protein
MLAIYTFYSTYTFLPSFPIIVFCDPYDLDPLIKNRPMSILKAKDTGRCLTVKALRRFSMLLMAHLIRRAYIFFVQKVCIEMRLKIKVLAFTGKICLDGYASQ